MSTPYEQTAGKLAVLFEQYWAINEQIARWSLLGIAQEAQQIAPAAAYLGLEDSDQNSGMSVSAFYDEHGQQVPDADGSFVPDSDDFGMCANLNAATRDIWGKYTVTVDGRLRLDLTAAIFVNPDADR